MSDICGQDLVSEISAETEHIEKAPRSFLERLFTACGFNLNSVADQDVLNLDLRGVRCRGSAFLGRDILLRLRDHSEDFFHEQVEKWYKVEEGQRVARIRVPLKGDVLPCYWKSSQSRGFWAGLLRDLRFTGAARAWNLGRAIYDQGVRTPRPLAYISSQRGAQGEEYLLTAAVPQATSIYEFLKDTFATLPQNVQRLWRRGVSCELGKQVAKLHAGGFDHRDLKATNLLVLEDPARTHVWIIDLEGMRQRIWLTASRIVQNLARLNVSSIARAGFQNSDRLRFLLSYLGERNKAVWKRWWKQIAAASRERMERYQRLGKPLH